MIFNHLTIDITLISIFLLFLADIFYFYSFKIPQIQYRPNETILQGIENYADPERYSKLREEILKKFQKVLDRKKMNLKFEINECQENMSWFASEKRPLKYKWSKTSIRKSESRIFSSWFNDTTKIFNFTICSMVLQI